MLYSYSRLTTPGGKIFLSDSLYSLAETVMMAYLACLFLLFLSIHNNFFSKSNIENNPENLLYHLQSPFRSSMYKLIFAISGLIYFVFFGFLSNIFIYFVDENTVFSIYPFAPSEHVTGETYGSHSINHHQKSPKSVGN